MHWRKCIQIASWDRGANGAQHRTACDKSEWAALGVGFACWFDVRCSNRKRRNCHLWGTLRDSAAAPFEKTLSMRSVGVKNRDLLRPDTPPEKVSHLVKVTDLGLSECLIYLFISFVAVAAALWNLSLHCCCGFNIYVFVRYIISIGPCVEIMSAAIICWCLNKWPFKRSASWDNFRLFISGTNSLGNCVVKHSKLWYI